MKKVYLLLMLASLGCMSLSAQYVNRHTDRAKTKAKLNTTAVARHVAPTGVNQTATVLWSDDFSIPANWVYTHAAGTSDDWTIGTNPPSGPLAIDPINSTSAANGFALFDSDQLCSHDQIANLTNASGIDLSGHQYVRLTFSQYYARYHDSTYVFVSNDGGTNWTRYEVNAGLGPNDFNEGNGNINPSIVSLDISTVAGNNDSVYIRFQFYSPDTNLTAVDTLAGCAYAWMIDDVSISDVPTIDGSVLPAHVGEYTMIPSIQPEAFTLQGKVYNNGATAFTGAKLHFTVYDPLGTPIYSDSSNASGTILPGDTSAFLVSTGTYLPTDTGLYEVDQQIILANDSDNTNDIVAGFGYVNDSIYARDYISFDVATFAGTVGYVTPISFGEVFHVWHASEFTSATFYLNSPTLGDHVSINVYDLSGGVPNNVLGASAAYTISAADTGGAFITLPFTSTVNVGVGDYFVAVNQLDTNNLTLGIATDVYTFHAGFINLNNTGWNTFEAANLNFALMLRVNNPSGTLLGVKDVAGQTSSFTVYPNPTTGMLHLTTSGVVQKDVTVKVINALGQIVKSERFDTFMNGRIDLSTFPAGVYTVNIRTSNGEENKNVVLK